MIQDISALGCRVALNHAFPVNQWLKIEFSLDGQNDIRAIGKVRNVNVVRGKGNLLSIAFKRISNRSRNRIYSYVFNYL